MSRPPTSSSDREPGQATDAQLTATGPRRPALLAAVGTGLVAAGLALSVAGWLEPVEPGRDEFPWPAVAGAAVVVLALVVALVLSVPMRRAPEHDVRLLARLCRRWSIVAAVIAACCAAYAWWQVLTELDGGLVAPALPLYAAGVTLLTVGCALFAVNGPGAVAARPIAAWSLALLTALAAGAAGVAAAVVVQRAPIDATTAAPAEPVAPVGAPEQVAWQWDTPNGEQLSWETVVSTANGVAILVDDGVVALDAETGEELWHYRVSGAEARDISASPSGAWVMATFASGNDSEGGQRLVAFHGDSGELGFDDVGGLGASYRSYNLDLTDHVPSAARRTTAG
ncbi:PQQ-binding-like beta-propeller repeat protein [Jiangella asiatica]|uniref:PQQ-binding-like beta-propeller repeat protein n=1 Tax=Jiangella asiatica TaxID=2530372 RepID=UPI0013A5D6C5|nr:PQQ-binding-like beta-propeller repeat protein [Jiangella asiatica]